MRETIPEVLLIESSAFDSPFADPRAIVESAEWLTGELRKWLPRMQIIFAFPPAEIISNHLRQLRTHFDLTGSRTSTRISSAARVTRGRFRTRQLWRVQSDTGRPEGFFEIDLHVDRKRVFEVPLGEVVAWEVVAAAVVEYAAVMAIPVETSLEDEPEF